jgi:hypothetical protein
MRVDVSVVDGQLEEKVAYEPMDEIQARIFTGLGSPAGPLPHRQGASYLFGKIWPRPRAADPAAYGVWRTDEHDVWCWGWRWPPWWADKGAGSPVRLY